MARMPRIGDRSPELERIGAVLASGAMLLGAGLLVSGCGGHGSEASPAASPGSASPTQATASPSPHHYRAVKVEPATKKASRRATAAYLSLSTKVLANPRQQAGHSHPLISGPAFEALQAMRTEYASKHYRVVGKPVVVSEKVIRRQTRPERLVVAACLDNSHVRVLDKSGEPVLTSRASVRSLNLLTLRKHGDHWVVEGTRFPDNPNC